MERFKRNAERRLEKWKLSKKRKPLVIRGARQVGKTTIVSNFSQSYKYYIELNLERKTDLAFFNKYDDVRLIMEDISLSRQIPFTELDSTLLFIDEIQESEKAIHLLRYFYEDLPQLHVIAAGSLLEFAISDKHSFPVGRVQYLYMYPLNFPEYLNATKATLLLDELNRIPVKKVAHQTLINHFNKYAIIGGMPEVVAEYTESQNLSDLVEIYDGIWETYKEDVKKYGSNANEKRVIGHIMQTAPSFLDQRIKFQNFGNSNYKSREVSEAMKALDLAKVIRLIYPTTDMKLPLRPDFKKSPRLQFLDSGIVNHTLNIQSDLLGVEDLCQLFKGKLIPHLLTQELISLSETNNNKPLFWVRDKAQSSAEVDLLFPFSNLAIPIEIKSGKVGTLKSLHQFMDTVNHPFAVRIYGGEFSIEQQKTPKGTPYILMNLPYYLGTKIPEYVAYLVNNYNPKFGIEI